MRTTEMNDMTDTFGFADLEDDVVNGEFKPSKRAGAGGYAKKVGFGMSSVDTGERFIENCKACHGSGRFISYSGRVVGPCFKCKGKGKLAFKNPAHVREKAKADRENRKVNKVDAFAKENPEIVSWLNANTSFDFAVSLKTNLYKYGSLTDGQVAAVRKCIDRNKARQEARKADSVEIDVTKIQQAFSAAMAGGFKNLKLRMVGFAFTLAKPHSKNPGAIYVTFENVYKGKIIDGRFFPCDCSPQILSLLNEVSVDPEAAAIAYGQQTGNCSCCGKTLTVKKSIDLGIGPICRAKYGW